MIIFGSGYTYRVLDGHDNNPEVGFWRHDWFVEPDTIGLLNQKICFNVGLVHAIELEGFLPAQFLRWVSTRLL